MDDKVIWSTSHAFPAIGPQDFAPLMGASVSTTQVGSDWHIVLEGQEEAEAVHAFRLLVKAPGDDMWQARDNEYTPFSWDPHDDPFEAELGPIHPGETALLFQQTVIGPDYDFWSDPQIEYQFTAPGWTAPVNEEGESFIPFEGEVSAAPEIVSIESTTEGHDVINIRRNSTNDDEIVIV